MAERQPHAVLENRAIGGMKPDIGVVIPAFRAATTIARTLHSALADVAPDRIAVVLDGPDATLETAARAVSADIRVVVLPHKQGAPACRNLGFSLLDTRYVIFLDADDYVEDGFLAGAGAAADAAEADLTFGRFAFEMPDGTRRLVDPSNLYEPLDCGTVMRRWLVGGYVAPCAVVWRSDFVRVLGGWDESLAKNQDGDIVHRALMHGARLTTSSTGLGVYVQDDNPDRITLKHNRRTLASQIAVLDKIRLALDDLPFDPAPELARAYYAIARLAFTVGVDDLGTQAQGAARDLGLNRQTGSLSHVVLATMLGLKGKQKLANLVRQTLRH